MAFSSSFFVSFCFYLFALSLPLSLAVCEPRTRCHCSFVGTLLRKLNRGKPRERVNLCNGTKKEHGALTNHNDKGRKTNQRADCGRVAYESQSERHPDPTARQTLFVLVSSRSVRFSRRQQRQSQKQ